MVERGLPCTLQTCADLPCQVMWMQAIKCGSKDNLSCMIVLLGGGEVPASTLAS